MRSSVFGRGLGHTGIFRFFGQEDACKSGGHSVSILVLLKSRNASDAGNKANFDSKGKGGASAPPRRSQEGEGINDDFQKHLGPY
jgi:hypothetical protein